MTSLILFDESVEGSFSDAPWEQRPEEPHALFLLFTELFLRQSPPRTYTKAYELYTEKYDGEGISKQALNNVAAAWKWKERASAYDNYLAEESRRLYEERYKELREQEWDLAGMALSVVKAQLEKELDDIANGKKKSISFTQLVKSHGSLLKKTKLIEKLNHK